MGDRCDEGWNHHETSAGLLAPTKPHAHHGTHAGTPQTQHQHRNALAPGLARTPASAAARHLPRCPGRRCGPAAGGNDRVGTYMLAWQTAGMQLWLPC